MKLTWPKQIDPRCRRDIGAGPKCFAVDRCGAQSWQRQRVRLTSNLFVVVTHGSVVVQSGQQRTQIKEGGGCLVLPGDLVVTEVPDRVGRIRNSWTFFNDRAIGDCLKKAPVVEKLAAIVFPACHGVYPVHNNACLKMWSARIQKPVFAEGFRIGFRQFLATCSSIASMFLRNGFFSRKRALNLWLESQLLSGVEHNQLPAAYPGGRRRFQCAWATYQTLSPDAWIRRRRMQLASVWIRHGDTPIESIRQALGYKCPDRFASDYFAERRIKAEAEQRAGDGRQLPASALRQKLRPFWHLDENELRQQISGADGEVGMHAGGPSTGDIPKIGSFWDLKSTAIPELFAA